MYFYNYQQDCIENEINISAYRLLTRCIDLHNMHWLRFIKPLLFFFFVFLFFLHFIDCLQSNTLATPTGTLVEVSLDFTIFLDMILIYSKILLYLLKSLCLF